MIKTGPSQLNLDPQVLAFLSKAMLVKATLDPAVYEDLKRQHPFDFLTCQKDIEDCVSVLLPEDNNEEKFIVDDIMHKLHHINLLHAVLVCMAKNQITKFYQAILYEFWHRAVLTYSTVTAILALETLSVNDREYYSDFLKQCFSLLEYYSPKFSNLIDVLIENKTFAQALANKNKIGLWASYISLFNIDHFHSVFLNNVGMVEESKIANERLRQRLKQHKRDKVVAIQKVDGSKYDANADLIRLLSNLKMMDEVYILSAPKRATSSTLTIDDLISEVCQHQTWKTLDDKALYHKYVHLFSEHNLSDSFKYIVDKALREIGGPLNISIFQNNIHILYFIIRHNIIPNDPKLAHFRNHLVMLMQTAIGKSLLGIYSMFFEAYFANIKGKYSFYCKRFEENYELYVLYADVLQELMGSMLEEKNNTDEKDFYQALSKTLLELCMLRIKIEIKYICFATIVNKQDNVAKAKERRTLYLGFAYKNLTKLVKLTASALTKRDAQKNLDFIEKLPLNPFASRVVKKHGKNQVDVELNENDLSFILSTIANVTDSEHSLKDKNLTKKQKANLQSTSTWLPFAANAKDFDEKLLSYLNATFKLLTSVHHEFDDIEESILLLNCQASLCETWGLIYERRSLRLDYNSIDNFYVNLIVEKLAALSRCYREQANERQAYVDKMPSKEKVLAILRKGELVVEEPHLECFDHDAVASYVGGSSILSPMAKVVVLHYVLQKQNERGIVNPVVLCQFWLALEKCCVKSFSEWGRNAPEFGECHELFDTIQSCMSMYHHYKPSVQALLNDALHGKASALVKDNIGKLFDRFYGFHQIEFYEINFETMLGLPGGTKRLFQAKEEFENFKKAVGQFESIDGHLLHREGILKCHTNALAELTGEFAEFAGVDVLGVMYQQLLAIQKLLKTPYVTNISTVEVNVTPLMQLEKLLITSKEPSPNDLLVVIGVLKVLFCEEFAYERYYSLKALRTLFVQWFGMPQNTLIEKLIAEKLQHLSAVCFNLADKLSKEPILHTVNQAMVLEFMQDLSGVNAIGTQQAYGVIFAKYHDRLFQNRQLAFSTINGLLFEMGANPNNLGIMNVVRALLSFGFIDTSLPSSSTVQTMFEVILWDKLIASFTYLCDYILTKKIDKGRYHASVRAVEDHMQLFKAYLPNFNALLTQWDNEGKVIITFESSSRWRLFKSLFAFEHLYASVLLAQWRLKEAKVSYDKADKTIQRLRNFAFGKNNTDQLENLAKAQNELTPSFGALDKSFYKLKKMGNILAELTRFEKKYLDVLVSLTQVCIAPSERQPKLVMITFQNEDDIITLFNIFLKIHISAYRSKAPENLTHLIEQFEAALAKFQQVVDKRLNESIVVELITEKLEAIVAECKKTLPLIQTQTNHAPIVEPITQVVPVLLLSKKLNNINIVKSSPSVTPITHRVPKEEQPPRVAIERLQALLQEAIATSASFDSYQSHDVFDKYYDLFSDEHVMQEVVTAAIQKAENLKKSTPIEHQSVVNLGHFVLVHFTAKLKDNHHLKQVLIGHIWESLKSLILESVKSCLRNNLAPGTCLNARNKLAFEFELYSLYLNKRDVRKGLATLDDKLLSQIESLLHREPFFELLMQFYAQWFDDETRPVELSSNFLLTSALVKQYREFNLDNLKAVLSLSTKTSADEIFVSHFNTIFKTWLQSLKKQRLAFSDKLIVAMVQKILDESPAYFEMIRNKRIALRSSADAERSVDSSTSMLIDKQALTALDDVSTQLQELTLQTVCDRESQLMIQDEADSQGMSERQIVEPQNRMQKMTSLVQEVVAFEPRKFKVPKELISGQLSAFFARREFAPLQDVLVKLRYNQISYELRGGFIRDFLLNKPFHDFDFHIKCNVSVIMNLFKDAYQPVPNKRPELIRLKQLDDLGIRHDFVCASEDNIMIPDFTINALSWNGERLEDPYQVIDNLEHPILAMIGEPSQRFMEDPCLVFRSIRLMNWTQKTLQDDAWKALMYCASTVSHLEMGLYLNNMANLFLRSYQDACLNLESIIINDLYGCLLPPPLCHAVEFKKYLESQWFKNQIGDLYLRHSHNGCVNFFEGTPHYKKLSFELLSFFLLPLVRVSTIPHVVNDFCSNYKGFYQDNPQWDENARMLKKQELDREKQKTARILTELLTRLVNRAQANARTHQYASFVPLYQQQIAPQPEQQIVFSEESQSAELKLSALK